MGRLALISSGSLIAFPPPTRLRIMACVPQPLTWVSVIAAAAAVAAVPGTSREPVLKQIRLPHAYYYREMYVPQVTSGPTSATWSPDGQELIYSMQGSLWRHRTARASIPANLGDGYDYQPDWSPDGRHVVYATSPQRRG